jgi:hypothetical protein
MIDLLYLFIVHVIEVPRLFIHILTYSFIHSLLIFHLLIYCFIYLFIYYFLFSV